VSKAKNLIPAITTNINGEIFDSGHYKSDKTMHAAGGIISTVLDLSLWLKVKWTQKFTKRSHNFKTLFVKIIRIV